MAGPTYTYTQDVPQGSQRISATQAPIQNNFQAINELIAVNHVSFNTADDFGKHKWVSFPVQGSAPTFSSGEVGLYNLLDATTSKDELYVHKIQNATTTEIPMTASVLSASTPSQGGKGWAYLPSGIIIQWGDGSLSGVADSVVTSTINLSTSPNIAFPTQILNAQVTQQSSSSTGISRRAFMAVNLVSSSSFEVKVLATIGSAGAIAFRWVAIGY